jgi:hypothetical protein
VARIEKDRKTYKVLVGKPEGRRPLGRPRRRWEDGIRKDVREIGWWWGGFSWLKQELVKGSCEYDALPVGSGAMELVNGSTLTYCYNF